MAKNNGPKPFVSGPVSQFMQAMLRIAESPAVQDILNPLLDVERDEVHWEILDYGVLSGGQKTALSWAWAIWTCSVPPEGWRDPFEGFGVMDARLQRAVIEALLRRHGGLR